MNSSLLNGSLHRWARRLGPMASVVALMAYADRAASQEGAAPGAPSGTSAAASPDAPTGMVAPSSATNAGDGMTIDQIKTKAKTIVGRVSSVEDQIRAMLETAQDQRDVVRVLCLADKNNQVGLALGTARDRNASLLAALTRGSEARARHEFRLLSVVSERVEFLVAEANQCLGEEAGPFGDSTLVVDVDPNLPAADPAEVTTPPIGAVVPLVPSPTD